MPSPSPLLALLHTLLLLTLSARAANWNTDVGILATERLDPIISPNGVAQHMHSIIGGSAFAAAYNQPDLMKSKCSTFPVSVDKSNYWHPKPYWINNNGSSFTPLPIHDRVYYIREHNSPNEPIQPFPEGLRMIVGNPNSKSADPRSFQYLCRVADKFNGPGDIWSDTWQFDRDCPRGILAQHKFPPCWNGKDLYKSDQSHMAYPQYEAFYGACPASHPIRLPGIMLEVLILTSRWAPGEAVRGKLAWANGDTTGYGIHADFTNGWDTEILRRALNDPVCNTRDDITFQQCPVFQPFLRTGSCQPERGVLTETFAHNDLVPITRLPGCNPLWTSGAKPGCSSMPSDPDVSPHRAVDGPKVPAQPAVPALPTLPGWSELACVKTADNMLLNQRRSYDNSVSQTTCFDACLRSGYTYASIGRAWGSSWVCDCGTGLNPATPVFPGMCNLTCPTNSSQGCGGSGAHSVFVAPNGTTTIGDYTTSLGCYANPAAGKTGLEQAASYSFSSWNLMTRELCGQGCADRNLDWAAIRGDRCFCGTRANFQLGDGNYVNEAQCTNKCPGNQAQTCGYWGGLSIFNVTASGYTGTQINKAPGYVQCYSDTSRNSLTGAQYYDANLTPQRCQFGCRDLGYSLAAVHGGGMCLCGNSLPTVSVLPVAMCSSKCTDLTTSFTCGGPGNAELYNTSVVAAEVQSFNARRPTGWQGCFGNSANNVTADFTVNEGRMTVTRCVAACNELGYSWAGLQNRDQCRCSKSDPRVNTKPFAANNFCAIPCNGDANQRCGGWGYIDLYHSPVSTTPGTSNSTVDNGVPTLPGYQGCFNGSQPLPTYNWWNGAMTVEQCTRGCKEIGQPIAAINSGTCSCGPRWTGGTQLSSLSCGNVCSGNSAQRCGGWPGQSSVYRTEVAADTPKPAGYLGCWQETSPKAVQGYGQWLDAQSVDNCRAICSARGFLLAGLNNVKQCWCGNSLSSASTQIPSQFCANPCPANSGQNCGQWNSAALYRATGNDDMAIPRNVNGVVVTPSSSVAPSSTVSSSRVASSSASSASSSRAASTSSSAPPISSSASRASSSSSASSSRPVSSSAPSASSSSSSRPASSVSSSSSAAAPASTSASCNSDVRTLTGPSYSSSFMTQDTCLFWCREKAMAFAGVSGNACTCGNTRPSTAATTCTTRCSGDASQMCGGSNVATVFTTSATGMTDPYTSTDAMGSLGCWTDSNTRLLPSASFTHNAMTPAMCVAGCQTRGFKYAGLQHSTQCHCANELNAKSNNWKAPSQECSARCGGDRDQVCGGSWRMNVYEVARAALAAPSSTTSSSASSSSSRASSSTVLTTSTTATSSTIAPSSTVTTSSRSASSTASSTSTTSSTSTSLRTSTASSTSTTSSISSTTSSTSPSATPSGSSIANEYVGCFIDQNPRSLPDFTFWTNDMTPQKCRDTCRERGFAVSGTTYSRECFCGNDLPTRKTDDKECSSVCAGDNKLKCGGFWRLSVYAEGGAARASTTRAARRRRSRR